MGKNLKGKELGKGIRQRDNGLYDARTQINGIDIHISHTNLAILKQEFNQAKKEAKKGNAIIATTYTLNQWFEEWLKTYKSVQLKASSIPVVCSKYYRMFGNTIGQKNIKEVLSFDIQICINNYMEAGKSMNELRSAFDNLSECFKFAKVNKLIRDNPCDVITVPKKEQRPDSYK